MSQLILDKVGEKCLPGASIWPAHKPCPAVPPPAIREGPETMGPPGRDQSTGSKMVSYLHSQRFLALFSLQLKVLTGK